MEDSGIDELERIPAEKLEEFMQQQINSMCDILENFGVTPTHACILVVSIFITTTLEGDIACSDDYIMSKEDVRRMTDIMLKNHRKNADEFIDRFLMDESKKGTIQ